MEKVLQLVLRDFVMVYIDDIIISSNSKLEHVKHLTKYLNYFRMLN